MAASRRGLAAKILGPAVSAAIVVWIALRVDWPALRAAFARFDPRWVPAMAGVYLASFVPRGLRWRIMLRPIEAVPWRVCAAVCCIGIGANNLLPARLGEVVRAHVIARRTRDVGLVAGLASVLVERIFDGLVLLAILVGTASVATFRPEAAGTVRAIALGAGAVFLGALAVVVVARAWPALAEAVVGALLRPLPDRISEKVDGFYRSALRALQFLRLDGSLATFAFWGFAVWGLEGAVFWMALRAFGMPADPVVAFFTLAVVNFGMLIPSAPGYVGVFQAGAIVALGAVGVPEAAALGYAVVVHLHQWVPATAATAALLRGSDLSLGRLRELEETP